MEPMRRLPRFLLIALTALVAAGCAGGSSVSQSVDQSLRIQGGSGNIVDLASHHYQVGDVSGTTLAGSHLSLTSLRGKVVVVNFWGSWCAPCHEEEPAFAQLARDDAKKGVAFLGIDERDSVAAARSFEREYAVPYPSIFDGNESLALQFPHAVPASTPTTIVIGRDGQILAKVTGGLEFTQLRSLVDAVLAEQV
jgi:thiol-disulfide isomerase/thioredoxin